MLWFIVRKKYILQDMEDKDDKRTGRQAGKTDQYGVWQSIRKLYTKLDLHNLAHIQVGQTVNSLQK